MSQSGSFNNERAERKHVVKKVFFIVLAIIAVSVLTASPAFAGGDKVRGDKGQGEVVQVQVQDPPPFQP